MMQLIDRPAKNRRKVIDRDLGWDIAIEEILKATRLNGKAVKMELADFHSSPAKGRLWKAGFQVHHRVIDRYHVAAWVE